MAEQRPEVSILIPNYNNGRESSHNGQVDFIGLLCQSLHDTLREDPTSLEVIAYDDGSTDDSLETLRTWSQKTWRGGPFLELIEEAHCGVLAKTANVLSRQARGRILVRLDGDVQMLTPNWAEKLVAFFDSAPPRTGVVAPKQLHPEHYILAFGDWIIHPNGYHHVAAGYPRHAVRYPMEVDHAMGCCYCCRREVYEELEGYDETFLRGQTIDFGLRARLAGWRCFAIPQIEFVHAHALRRRRETSADSNDGIIRSLNRFTEKWGFNRIAPDLDVVRERYGRTPLCWHPRWTCQPTFPPENGEPIDVERSEWGRFAENAGQQQHVRQMAELVQQVAQQVPGVTPIVHAPAGQGLVAHVLARAGATVIGIEKSRRNRAIAETCFERDTYPGEKPRLIDQPDDRRLPLEDGSVGMLLMTQYLDLHPNPVRALGEARRVVRPGGVVVVLAERRRTIDYDLANAAHPYTSRELIQQVNTVGGWQMLRTPENDARSDLLLIAKRV